MAGEFSEGDTIILKANAEGAIDLINPQKTT